MPEAPTPSATENWQDAGFGLYLHWPFCMAKCPYCDFNSHVAASIDQTRWAKAYVAEIERAAAETPGRVLHSIFFGGGTPSLMEPDVVHTILDTVRRNWTVANDAEITLEANPTSVEAGRFRGYAAAGVNRLSLGVQALNDVDLRALGRLHSAAEARAAFDLARSVFPRISFDLIYARQDQTAAQWEAELSLAIGLAVDHLSLYQLTIEPGTAFGARYDAGKLRGLPDEDLSADLWDITQDITGAAGLAAYETSNHAADGAQSRHNLIYWRQGDYVGIGPGAHGRLTLSGVRYATEAAKAPGRWLDDVARGRGEILRDRLTDEDVRVERVMMGLRLSEGILLERVGGDEKFHRSVSELIDLGLMWRGEGRIGVTPAGRPVLNAVLRRLLAD